MWKPQDDFLSLNERKKKAEEKDELMAKAVSTTYSYNQKDEFCFRWEVVGETFDHQDQSELGPEGCVFNEIQNAWMSFSDWRHEALMLQDRLHKHLRNVTARKETAVRNERSHFPSYAQTGCHYARCALPQDEDLNENGSGSGGNFPLNAAPNFAKPASFTSRVLRGCLCFQTMEYSQRRQTTRRTHW